MRCSEVVLVQHDQDDHTPPEAIESKAPSGCFNSLVSSQNKSKVEEIYDFDAFGGFHGAANAAGHQLVPAAPLPVVEQLQLAASLPGMPPFAAAFAPVAAGCSQLPPWLRRSATN